jgi:Spy/CpxP family protein refolding chaperone
MLFKGITLTADQKARLKELRKNSVSTESREQFRKAMTEAREARQRGDTATARAKMQAVRTEMEKNREREFAAIRGILTPEQQRQFDANVAEMKQHAAQRGARKGEGGREGWRGERGRSGK